MRATFRIIDKQLKVWDIIGRSLCISEKPNTRHGDSGERLACGVIARSANVFRNSKKICECSGKTVWDERLDAKTNKANSKI
jgi:copper chaperone for superoxide dismutase